MIHTLTYVSTLRDTGSGDELEEVLVTSRERNAAQEITGVLLVRQRHVMQILEGPEQAVSDLYRRIENDSRHFDSPRSGPAPAPTAATPTGRWAGGGGAR